MGCTTQLTLHPLGDRAMFYTVNPFVLYGTNAERSKTDSAVEGKAKQATAVAGAPTNQAAVTAKKRTLVTGIKPELQDGSKPAIKKERNAAEPNNETWKSMLCWVKCDAAGQPSSPFKCGGLAEQHQQAPSSSSGAQRNDRDLITDFGFPPKGDALHMRNPAKHVESSKQLPLSFVQNGTTCYTPAWILPLAFNLSY